MQFAALGIEVPAKLSNKRKILKDSKEVRSADFKFASLEGKCISKWQVCLEKGML